MKQVYLQLHVPKTAGSALWHYLFGEAFAKDPNEQVYFVADSYYHARHDPRFLSTLTDIDKRVAELIREEREHHFDRTGGALREEEAFTDLLEKFMNDKRKTLLIHCHSLPALDLSNPKYLGKVEFNLVVVMRNNEERLMSCIRHLLDKFVRKNGKAEADIEHFKDVFPILFNSNFFRGYQNVSEIYNNQSNRNIKLLTVDFKKLLSNESRVVTSLVEQLNFNDLYLPIIDQVITGKDNNKFIIDEIVGDKSLSKCFKLIIETENLASNFLIKNSQFSDF